MAMISPAPSVPRAYPFGVYDLARNKGLFTDLSAVVRRSESEHSYAPSGWDEQWPTSA